MPSPTTASSEANARPKPTTYHSGQESSSTRPATTRQRRRCGRRTRARRGPRFRRPARRYSGPFEARNADHAAPFVRLSARRLKKTAQRDRLPAQRSISPCPRAAQVAEPDDVDEKLLRRWREGAGPRVAPSPRGTAQYTARVPTHDPPDLVPFAPTLPPPARRPPVPRITTATQEHHGARRRRPARAAGATPRPPPTHRDMNDPT